LIQLIQFRNNNIQRSIELLLMLVSPLIIAVSGSFIVTVVLLLLTVAISDK